MFKKIQINLFTYDFHVKKKLSGNLEIVIKLESLEMLKQ